MYQRKRGPAGQTTKKKFILKKNAKEKWRSFYKLLRKHVIFCLSIASMHGLIYQVRRKLHLSERILWLALVAVGISFGVWQSLQIWNRYQTSPVVISIEKEYRNWKINFPAVTVCQRVTHPAAYKAFAKYGISKEQEDEFKEYVQDIFSKTFYDYKNFEGYANGSRKDFLSPHLWRDLGFSSIGLLLEDGPSSRSQKNTFPHSYDARPFDHIFTEYGLCSVYNSYLANYFVTGKRNATKASSTVVMSYNDIPTFFSSRAILGDSDVFFHAPNEIININVPPGRAKKEYLTAFALDALSVVSDRSLMDLTPSQTQCRFPHEHEDLKHSPIYSYNLCRIECRIRLCLKYCKCIPFYYPQLNGETLCNMTGLYCLSQYEDALVSLTDPTTKDDTCSCLPNCDIDRYIVSSVTLSQWFMETGFQIDVIKFPHQRYRRAQIFTKTDVLAQIGGLFGLLLGCSILSFIEFPYFATLRCFWGVFRNRPIQADL